MTQPHIPAPGHHPIYGDLPAQVHGLAGRFGLRRMEQQHDNRTVLGIYVLINSAISIALLGTLAALTKQPFVFPSLGPTAFLIFYDALGAQAAPRNVFCGHLIAVLTGYLALVTFGLTTTPADLSDITAHRIEAVTLGLCLTLALMIALRAPHAPACATVLIVGLGLMRTPGQLTVLMVAVVLMIVQGLAINRLARLPYPLWAPNKAAKLPSIAPADGPRSGAAIRKDAELVPFRVCKGDPWLLASLADVGVLSTEVKQTTYLFGLLPVGRVDVEVDPVLHGLAFRHASECQRRWHYA